MHISSRFMLQPVSSSRKAMLACIIIFTFCCSLYNSARGHTDPQDVDALRILYESLRSPATLSGWSFDGADPCGDGWQGVECSGASIISIRLPGLGLRGSIGFSLNKLTSLLILDLSNNHIGEMLPFELPPRVVQLCLSNNVLIGAIPYSVKRLMALTNLNLSTNFLSGRIPDLFYRLTNLQTLDISNNNFSGQLPSSFAALSSLSTLHLQQNQLNGSLSVLEKLPLKDLYIGGNKFKDPLPPELRSIPIFRTDGNKTRPPNGALPLQGAGPNEPLLPTSEDAASITGSKLAGIISGAIASALIFTFILLLLHRPCANRPTPFNGSESSRPTLVVSPGTQKGRSDDVPEIQSPVDRMLKPLPVQRFKPPIEKFPSNPKLASAPTVSAPQYTFSEIQAATSNFSSDSLIGEGMLGRVYKGVFANGRVVAVKKLENSTFVTRKEEDVLAVIANIGRFHHANIVELIGYCADNGNCVLVYPYFPKGTLHDFMHVSRKELTWNRRMKIALGAAKALEYLHEACVPSAVHRNLKSANIMLDEEFNVYVSDVGVAALVPFGTERQISAQLLSAFGYSAPEYALSGIYTAKSDVYSFGVVMLELLTGREPLDNLKSRSKEQSLVSSTASKLHDIDQLSKIIDPSLEGMYPAKAVTGYAELIAQCIQTDPERRPVMSEMVQSLVGLIQRASKKTTTTPAASGEIASRDVQQETVHETIIEL